MTDTVLKATTAHHQAKAPALNSLSAIILAIAVAGLIVAPFMVYPIFLMKMLCFALFASAFNLLLGYTGILSFGHAAFFGGAAYVTAHAVKVWGVTPEIGILLGMLAAAVLGLIIGYLAIRRQGIYSTMITLALAQMFFFFCLQASFTHGEDGLQGVPRGYLFGFIDLNQPMNMYYLVLALFVIGVFAIWRIINSPFGMILKSVRENENRAVSLGYSVNHYKLAAFVMSGLPVCHPHRCGMADVGRSDPDDAAGRHRNADRPNRRCSLRGGFAELSCNLRLPRDNCHRRHLHGLRSALP